MAQTQTTSTSSRERKGDEGAARLWPIEESVPLNIQFEKEHVDKATIEALLGPDGELDFEYHKISEDEFVRVRLTPHVPINKEIVFVFGLLCVGIRDPPHFGPVQMHRNLDVLLDHNKEPD